LIDFTLTIAGIPLDAFRGYQTAGAGASPYVFASHAGQTMQQPALYAAQLQAVAQQQQAQMAAAVAAQQQQQQQQQSLMNGIPAGCMLVRLANGSYALLAQSTTASAAAIQQQQQQQQAQLAQQQYLSYNAAGQSTAAAARLALVGGQQQQQQQQFVYQYAGQPTAQGAPTQYIQLPANYAQQQQLSTSPVLQATTSATSQSLFSFKIE
jgi:hypothetical protein